MKTARAILLKMQEEVCHLGNALDDVEGNAVNVAQLRDALTRVLNELDIAVQRAGRI